jgi:hypothetical protein
MGVLRHLGDCIASGRRIILLTVFSKQRRRERAEIARAVVR